MFLTFVLKLGFTLIFVAVPAIFILLFASIVVHSMSGARKDFLYFCIETIGLSLLANVPISIFIYAASMDYPKLKIFFFAVSLLIGLFLYLFLDRNGYLESVKISKMLSVCIYCIITVLMVIVFCIVNWRFNFNEDPESKSNVVEYERTIKISSFCDISLQELPSEDSDTTDDISIANSNTYTYSIYHEDGTNEFFSVPQSQCTLVAVPEVSASRVHISHYCDMIYVTNYFTGKCDWKAICSWDEYTIYLPEDIINRIANN